MSFTLPLAAAAFLLGICSTLWLPDLPATSTVLILGAFSCAYLFVATKKILQFVCIGCIGFAYMVFSINLHLSHSLDPDLEGKKVEVVGTVVSVPEFNAQKTAKILVKITAVSGTQIDLTLPLLVQLNWQQAPKKIAPGQTWNLQVKLKRPRNFANPGSFDSEKYYFQQRISAIGNVVVKSKPQLLNSYWYREPVNRLRYEILDFLATNLENQKYTGIITALVLGLKTLMPASQWQILQNTGTAHLMSISGMHIGLIAAVVFFILRLSWRFAPASWMRLPAPMLAAWAALIASFGYALLAGFTIATQRALIMICVLMCGLLFKRKIAILQRYCLALFLVLLLDPLAVLSAGFWLSFLAVGSLFYACSGRTNSNHRLYKWLKPQLVITIALLPISLLYFNQSSIIGPLANLIAIPWISIIVVPISLLATMLVAIDSSLAIEIFDLAEQCCAVLWPILEYFNNFPVYVWQTPDKYLALKLFCATIGVLWLFVPKGIPGRAWGIIGFLPLFFANTAIIPLGQAQFTLLDVGQGLAAVIRTQQHILVYDTGAKTSNEFDFGTQVVAPYLRTLGIKIINILMISHIDNDHIGGAKGLLAKIPAQQVMLNDQHLLNEQLKIPCQAGQSWIWDEVQFTVLHPTASYISKKRNDQSCVLMVHAGSHKVLLTGDIEKKAELSLVQEFAQQLQADILLVPHHGSKTSSSPEFLAQVRPRYSLVPAGYKNQYGHPKQLILERYQNLGSTILRTDYHGAITFLLGKHSIELRPHMHRIAQNKFWHAKP